MKPEAIPHRMVVYTTRKGEKIMGVVTHKRNPRDREYWVMYRFLPSRGGQPRWISVVSFGEVECPTSGSVS